MGYLIITIVDVHLKSLWTLMTTCPFSLPGAVWVLWWLLGPLPACDGDSWGVQAPEAGWESEPGRCQHRQEWGGAAGQLDGADQARGAYATGTF